MRAFTDSEVETNIVLAAALGVIGAALFARAIQRR